MKVGLLVLLAAAAMLAGCASYAKVLDSWRGATESDLVASWGPPDQVYQAPNGDRMLTYIQNDGSLVLRAAAVAVWCKATFTVGPSGEVMHWRTDGNNCDEAPPGRHARGGLAAKRSSVPQEPSKSTSADERGY